MNAEIIAAGSELLTPQRMDTNSLFLTAELNALGVEVVRKTIVGDDRARLAETVRAALASSEIVVLTGGLGPTEDDVTREAVAQALGRELVFRQELLDRITARFARMGRQMAEINRRQAYLIDGGEALANPNGTAPGQWIEHEGRIVMLLPGPPREMKPMFSGECLPRLMRRLPPLVIRTRVYRVAMMPESDLDQSISPVYKRYSNPVTTVLADIGDIQIHLRARCPTAEEAERRIEELGSQIETVLGDRIYTRDGEPLEAVVGAMLLKRGETLSVAESCTGGMLAERITSVPGSSKWFIGGFVTYAESMKTALAGVRSDILLAHGAVSPQTAEAMATGCRERTETSWAISITGVAGPDGGTEENPQGSVYIGVAGADGCEVTRIFAPGDRQRTRRMATQAALDLLRRRLMR
jgi:nicotinamide-nucleotide amidase